MAEPYHYDILSPVLSGMKMAAGPRELRMQEQSLDMQEARLLNEFRSARELSRYREVEQQMRESTEQRLRDKFKFDMALREQQSKVLENIQSETEALRGQMPYGPSTPEQDRDAEMSGMARGLFKSGLYPEGVNIMERQSAEKVARDREMRALRGVEPVVYNVGGVPIFANPVTGKYEVSPAYKDRILGDRTAARYRHSNATIKLKELYQLRADYVKANTKQSLAKIPELETEILDQEKLLEALAQSMGETETEPKTGGQGTESPVIDFDDFTNMRTR